MEGGLANQEESEWDGWMDGCEGLVCKAKVRGRHPARKIYCIFRL